MKYCLLYLEDADYKNLFFFYFSENLKIKWPEKYSHTPVFYALSGLKNKIDFAHEY